MKKVIIIAAILLNYMGLAAQDLEYIYAQIEQNNTELQALKANAEAAKKQNHTRLTPSDPLVQVSYLKGPGSDNNVDYSITQQLDFPTTYLHSHKVADQKDQMVDLSYQKRRSEILTEARLASISLIYYGIRVKQLNERKQHAKAIADMMEQKATTGELSSLEANRSKLYALSLSKEAELAGINLQKSRAVLRKLNGGKDLTIASYTFMDITLPENFEQWYTQVQPSHVLIEMSATNLGIRQQERKLAQAAALPKFNLGYVQENSMGQPFRGVSAGVSIPLWENKNTIKASKAREVASELEQDHQAMEVEQELNKLYQNVMALQTSREEFVTQLEQNNNLDLLNKAVEAGELSLIEYYFELGLLYAYQDQLLEMQFELHKSYSLLHQYIN